MGKGPRLAGDAEIQMDTGEQPPAVTADLTLWSSELSLVLITSWVQQCGRDSCITPLHSSPGTLCWGQCTGGDVSPRPDSLQKLFVF